MNQLQPIVVRTDCPACGSRGKVHRFVRRSDAQWDSCQCGLVYLNTIFPAQQRRDESIAPQVVESADVGRGGYGAYEHRRRRRVAKARHQILDVLNHTAPGPLLDIGCSLGYTLQAALDLGLAPSGIEVDPAVVERCRRSGFDVREAAMTQLPFADGQFQIVMMKHVLEHSPEPRVVLKEVHRVLRPGGGLFIAVPHLRYHKAMRHPETYRYFEFAGDGRGDGHYVYYTPESMRSMIDSLGFQTVKVHPHLMHRRASITLRLGQAAVAPARWIAQTMLARLHLRKEFWLVAVRL